MSGQALPGAEGGGRYTALLRPEPGDAGPAKPEVWTPMENRPRSMLRARSAVQGRTDNARRAMSIH